MAVESRCQFCNAKDDLRFDTCFACADAQSIIGTGEGMNEGCEGRTEIPCKEANERLRLLIKNGWRYVPSTH